MASTSDVLHSKELVINGFPIAWYSDVVTCDILTWHVIFWRSDMWYLPEWCPCKALWAGRSAPSLAAPTDLHSNALLQYSVSHVYSLEIYYKLLHSVFNCVFSSIESIYCLTMSLKISCWLILYCSQIYDIWYMLWYVMIYDIWYGMIYDMIWYGMVWYGTVWYDIWCIIWYDIFNCNWVATRWQ
jgi:hypothetical protein